MKRIFNHPDQKEFRRGLRANMTPSEATLWKAIKGKQLDGRKFRRQHGIGPFVADFYCPAERLVVEVDGSVHDNPTAVAYDQERDAYMNDMNIKVVRVSNKSVMDDLSGVLELIQSKFSDQQE